MSIPTRMALSVYFSFTHIESNLWIKYLKPVSVIWVYFISNLFSGNLEVVMSLLSFYI
jgi:hypothetical protein